MDKSAHNYPRCQRMLTIPPYHSLPPIGLHNYPPGEARERPVGRVGRERPCLRAGVKGALRGQHSAVWAQGNIPSLAFRDITLHRVTIAEVITKVKVATYTRATGKPVTREDEVLQPCDLRSGPKPFAFALIGLPLPSARRESGPTP